MTRDNIIELPSAWAPRREPSPPAAEVSWIERRLRDDRPDFREPRHVVIGSAFDALFYLAAGALAALIVVAVLVYLQIGGGQ